MLSSGLGEEIDSNQCVIRMNNAPTEGYEQDVGNRTSLRVVSHTSVPLLVKKELYYFHQAADTTYVFWGPDRNMRQDGKGQIFNVLLKIATKYPNVRMYTVTSEKIQYCDRVFQNETGKNRYSNSTINFEKLFVVTLEPLQYPLFWSLWGLEMQCLDTYKVTVFVGKVLLSSAPLTAVHFFSFFLQNKDGSISQYWIFYHDFGDRLVWQHPSFWNDRWQPLQVRCEVILLSVLQFLRCFFFFNAPLLWYFPVEKTTARSPTITTRGTASRNVGCTESTSIWNAGATAS